MIYPRTFFIETFGCTYNQGDSEKIARLFVEHQYLPTSLRHAEIIIINTCAVKSQTEAKILHRIKSLILEKGQRILVTGCLPWISNQLLSDIGKLNPNVFGILHPNSYKQLELLLDGGPLPNQIGILDRQDRQKKSAITPWVHQKNTPGIVQMSEGCNMSCTYCCTRISRGKSISYSLSDILNQIQFHINNGNKEIYLTSQDCGFYSWNSLKTADLLTKIENMFGTQDIFIRLGMTNPIIPSRIENLAKIIESSKIFYKFLHIPIQSASNHILTLMKRGYSSENLRDIFQNLHNSKITISTDVICGFPDESEEDFQITYEFLKEFQPEIVNISKFTARPNTEAKKMRQLDSQTIKKRSFLLSQLYSQYMVEKNKQWNGWKGKVVIHAFHPEKKFPYVSRNEFYKPIVLPKAQLNTIVSVEIIDSTGQFLVGRVINE